MPTATRVLVLAMAGVAVLAVVGHHAAQSPAPSGQSASGALSALPHGASTQQVAADGGLLTAAARFTADHLRPHGDRLPESIASALRDTLANNRGPRPLPMDGVSR